MVDESLPKLIGISQALEQRAMEKIPVFVGLDYHKDSVQICVMNQQGKELSNRSCRNNWKAIQRIAEKQGHVKRVAIESCSGAADLADELVQKAQWSVSLAHPGYVNRMKQNPDKTDFSDARMLADLERVGYLPRVWLAPQEIRELRLLVRYRLQQVILRRSIKQRIGAVLREQRIQSIGVTRWCKIWLKWLAETQELSAQGRWVVDHHLVRLKDTMEEISVVEKRLEQFTMKDPLVEKLMSQRGIGPVTAWVIRAEIGRFDRFRSGKQLSRFCGLSPRNASSGTRQADAGLIKAANTYLRTTLIEAAHRLARHDPNWRQMANKMRARGKPGSVVAAAVANRWMRRLFHVFAHQALPA